MDGRQFPTNKNHTPYSYEELYRLALDNYPGSVLIIDQDANILYANQVSENMLGVPKEWLLSTNMNTVLQLKLATHSCGLTALETQKPAKLYSCNSKNEGMFLSSVPVRSEDGQIAAVFTYSQDENSLSDYVEWMKAEKKRIFSALQFISGSSSVNTEVIAQSAAMRQVLEIAQQVAPSSGTVSLYGESGVGKEVVARYIHAHSKRKKELFLPVNCAAIPLELAESEFFGYARGAFTGARQGGKSGLFELANRGTIFLDEIGELPLSIQGKLLRVIENNQITRVGGSKLIDVDVRILCATNRDLKQMVAEGKFREDLFYRLEVIPIQIPPLRERREDIPPLAEKFLHETNRKNGLSKAFSAEVMDAFQKYNWPGNVRELRNMVERLAITSQADTITLNKVCPLLSAACPEEEIPSVPRELLPLRQAMREMERSYLGQALSRCQWNVREAAKVLDIHPSGLYKKIEDYGLKKRDKLTD